MLGVGLLIFIGLWGAVGFLLWRWLIRPRLHSRSAFVLVTLVASVVWFVGPIADELLGARKFKRLCNEMPPVEFYGPVHVGPGAFFDESGQPRWRNGDEFSRIRIRSKEWERVFDTRQEDTVISSWPFPIFELKTTDYERATGRPILISRMRGGRRWLVKARKRLGLDDPLRVSEQRKLPAGRNLDTFPLAAISGPLGRRSNFPISGPIRRLLTAFVGDRLRVSQHRRQEHAYLGRTAALPRFQALMRKMAYPDASVDAPNWVVSF